MQYYIEKHLLRILLTSLVSRLSKQAKRCVISFLRFFFSLLGLSGKEKPKPQIKTWKFFLRSRLHLNLFYEFSSIEIFSNYARTLKNCDVTTMFLRPLSINESAGTILIIL